MAGFNGLVVLKNERNDGVFVNQNANTARAYSNALLLYNDKMQVQMH